MNKILIVLLFALLAGALGAVAMHFKHQVTLVSRTLESERYNRLVAEEKVVNSVSKIKQLQDDLQDNEKKLAKITDVLKEQKDINQELEDQYQKLSKSKSQLEDQIQVLISQQAVAAAADQAVKEAAEKTQTESINEVVVPAGQ